MYPYVNVLTKEAYDLMTDNGKDLSFLESRNMAAEIVKVDDLPDALFGHTIVMQAHLIEVFKLSEAVDISDLVVAEPSIEELDGYKDVTPLLNESLEILDIPYKYKFKLFIPEHIEVIPKRFEYALLQLPLAFTAAVFLYRQAMMIIEEAVFKPEEMVLIKIVDNDGEQYD